VTPEAAVGRLAEIVAARAEFTEDQIHDAMAEAGISAVDSDKAYKFTQIAWGRVFLKSLGVRFSPDYVCFSGAGEVIETGRLVEQPYYAAAMSVAQRYAGVPGFQRLALMAAEVHAVNELLNKGSKPENLVTSSPVLFMKAATPAGIDRARRHLSKQVAVPKRPWWKFW
jgi:hypothetical protein